MAADKNIIHLSTFKPAVGNPANISEPNKVATTILDRPAANAMLESYRKYLLSQGKKPAERAQLEEALMQIDAFIRNSSDHHMSIFDASSASTVSRIFVDLLSDATFHKLNQNSNCNCITAMQLLIGMLKTEQSGQSVKANSATSVFEQHKPLPSDSNASDIVYSKPFDLEEAVILLDVYLHFVKSDGSYSAGARVASKRLRALAIGRGMHIANSFRSVKGIQGRLRAMESAYEGKGNRPAQGSITFKDAVELYRYNREQYQRILDDASSLLFKQVFDNPPTDHQPNFNAKEEIEEGMDLVDLIEQKTATPKIQKNWIRYNNTNAQRFERTNPVYCRIGAQRFDGKNWVQIYAAIVNHEIAAGNLAIAPLYETSLRGGPSDQPFLLKERPETLGFVQLENGYWVKTHYSIPQLVARIASFCRYCGYSDDEIILCGISKAASGIRSSVDSSSAQDKNMELLRAGIRRQYASGMRFDTTVFALLSDQTGIKITERMKKSLRDEMFERSDNLYFLPDTIATPAETERIKADARRLLNKFKLCESSRLWEMGIESKCIRNADDYADFLRFLLPDVLRIGKIGSIRTVRPAGISQAEAQASLASGIIGDILQNECMTEDEILEAYPVISAALLKKLLEKYADQIMTSTINDLPCYQTITYTGLDDNFSSTLSSVLENIEALDLTPNIDTLQALLSMSIGQNFRMAYDIADDKTFRRIIAKYYRGEQPREWKGSIFAKS